jgi:hypothetical protein
MADQQVHYVATIKIVKVTKNTTSITRGMEPTARKLIELGSVAVKSNDLDKLKEKAAKHIALIDDGEYSE